MLELSDHYFSIKHAEIMQLRAWPVDSKIFPVMLLTQPVNAIWLGNVHTDVLVAKQCNLKSLSLSFQKLNL